uniref:Glutamate decarboxylase n=1 Tax=Plectus sambesii TaxID=2011161 RepID=A0A914UT29_9BILA
MADIPTLCTFTSVDSHYSIKSASAVLGIGADNCFNIPTDRVGKMIPEALEAKIVECKRDGLHPFFVCATAGTTVYGAWDPIPQIADICEKHNIWLHVDAAWGGGLLLSPEHRYRLNGIERANSVTWNPHKLMGALLQCSATLIRQDGLLFQTNQMSADYLFQQDKPYDVSFDTGDKAMQCGRHNDTFKLWLMWKSKGMTGYAKQINRLMDLAAYFTAKIKQTPGYEMVVEDPEYLNICFWYVPPSLRGFDPAEKKARLEKIAPKIKAKMMERGTTMVGYQPDKDRPNFFRMIISNQAITREDLDFLIEEIITIGKDL